MPSNNISKSTLAKIINNNVSYIYPKTSIDNIVIDNNTNLDDKLDNIENRISVLEDNTPSSSGSGEELKGLIERNLTSINIPSSVTSIGNYAFYGCSSLTSINIPSSVTYIGSNAFQNCASLTSINIPSSVTRIEIYAFSFCTSLTSVTIGNGVTSILNNAFQKCTSLTSVNIPSSVTSIGINAFNSCTNLTSVTLGNNFNANNLNLSVSTKYSVETMVSWLNALYDRTGLSSYKLTIGSTNLNKLTAEQKAIATNKNWTLA